MTDNIELPHPVAHIAIGDDTEDVFTEEQIRAAILADRARQAPAPVDTQLRDAVERWDSAATALGFANVQDALDSIPAQRERPAPVEVSRLAEARTALKELAEEAQANGNSEQWVESRERSVLASLASTPVGEVPAERHDELSREADGSIALDWITKDRDMLTMSLSKDGTLHWAIHRAGPAGSGKAQLNEACFRLLDNLLDDCEAAASPAPAASKGDADWEHLKQYGYAPGGYMFKCRTCGTTAEFADKRAITCRSCAEDMHAKATTPSEPEAQKAVAELDSVQVARLFEDFRISDEGRRSIEYLTDRSLKPHLSTVHGALFVAFRAGLHASPSPAASMEDAATLCEGLAEMMEQGAGEARPGQRLRQAARGIRALAAKNGWRLGGAT